MNITHAISIHALMKRATHLLCVICMIVLYFNPRPHEEGDIAGVNYDFKTTNFNPRPHEEGDFFGGIHCLKSDYFNPRPHEEGDLLCLYQCF